MVKHPVSSGLDTKVHFYACTQITPPYGCSVQRGISAHTICQTFMWKKIWRSQKKCHQWDLWLKEWWQANSREHQYLEWKVTMHVLIKRKTFNVTGMSLLNHPSYMNINLLSEAKCYRCWKYFNRDLPGFHKGILLLHPWIIISYFYEWHLQ